MHWPEFVEKQDETLPTDAAEQKQKRDFLCNQGPPFKMYQYTDVKDPKTITHWTLSNKNKRETAISYAPSENPVSARFRHSQEGIKYRRANGTDDTSASANPHTNRLVMSKSAQHSAEGLCQSDTSVGPDFVNVADGTFCRMSDKTLFSVCDGAKTVDNCFNTDLQQLVVNGAVTRDKAYSSVLDWTLDD